jgi:hypothetical protein
MFYIATVQTVFTWIWLVWILAFGFIEGSAFVVRRWYPAKNNDGGTLSELVWRTIDGYAWYHRILYIGFLLFWAWLTVHFLS